MMNKKDFSIVCIGAGNVATHLAQALQQKGFHLSQIYSRTQESAEALAQTLGCAWTTCLEQVDEHADLYIVSVKDAVLETVISQLAHCNPDALYLHTAGSMPMEVWKEKFKNYGVAYPMQTFSKQREVNFEEVPFFLEANSPENLSLLQEIARSLPQRKTYGSHGGNIHFAKGKHKNYGNITRFSTQGLQKNWLQMKKLIRFFRQEQENTPSRKGIKKGVPLNSNLC